MKIWIAIITLIFSSNLNADQFSYQETSLQETDNFYGSGRKLQYNWGDEKYTFIQYQQDNICPHYCGFIEYMLGIGIGINHKVGPINLFAQGGYYFVRNSINQQQGNNENLDYYFTARFGAHPKMKSHSLTTDDTIAFTAGIDIPYDNWGFKISYQQMRVKEILRIDFEDGYWHDPMHRKMDKIGFGVYRRF